MMKVLISKKRKYFWFGGDFNTEDGIFKEEDIKKGGKVKTHLGREFSVIEPRLMDYFEVLKRGPQVVLPKDAAIMVTYCGIKEGDIVVEGGTGSGWLTIFLARAVGKKGKVISFEKRKEFLEIARRNLEKLNLIDRVELINRDIFEGIPECNHIILDLPEPWKIFKFKDKLRTGGYIAMYLPQMTQVLRVYKETGKFDDLVFERVVEIIEREWIIREKVCRPKQWLDHTAFLVFIRKI